MKGLPGILYIDSFEPDAIAGGLKPIMPSTVVPVNTWGKADYYWVDIAGNERMIERKQIGEALGDLNAVEEQLQRHLHECDELTLLVEGVALPTQDGVQVYDYRDEQWDTGQRWMQPGWYKGYAHRKQPKLWSRWHSFSSLSYCIRPLALHVRRC